MEVGAEAVRTRRLDLSRPAIADVDELYSVCRDPRLWTHYPSLRHTDPQMTRDAIERWQASWDQAGLGTWIARRRLDGRLVGSGGCSVYRGCLWNIGYRIAAQDQGHGYATEIAQEGIRWAQRVNPDYPLIAYLLEHNVASAGLATKLGLHLVDRGPDAGNPDPNAIRVIYANRALTPAELSAARR